jgi:hypothetical protein
MFYEHIFRSFYDLTERGSDESKTVYRGNPKTIFYTFYKKMRSKYGKEVVIQEDGAKYHFAPIPAAYKNSHKVQKLEWPP